MFQYPDGDLDAPARIAALLGSYWSRDYGGRGQAESYAGALGRAMAAVQARLNEAVAGLAVAAAPTTRRPEWRRVVLAPDGAGDGPAVVFGDGTLFGDGAAYGSRAAVGPNFALAGLADAGLIASGVGAPDVVLVRGLDFAVAAGVVTLDGDPFAAWPLRREAGGDEADLWLFRPDLDLGDLTTQYGYAFGLELPGTDAARRLMAAAWFATALGPARGRVDELVAAACGVPLAAGGETVADVGYDDRGLLVLTDRSAYRMAAAAAPLVAVGDALAAGDPLCDAVVGHDLSRGAPAALPYLVVGPGVLGPGYSGPLTFRNEDVAVAVDYDEDGRGRISWELGGEAADVEAFWGEVHARGVAGGTTLLEAMGGAPATVNPLAFLVRNALGANARLYTVRVAACGETPGDFGAMHLLRGLVPPGQMIVIDVETGDGLHGEVEKAAALAAGYESHASEGRLTVYI